MSFILKVVHRSDQSPVAADNEHSLYADIVSVHFTRDPAGEATAHLYVREPVKTADVPGFVEIEKHVVFDSVAYVMNESGKTVSSFTARTSGEGSSRAVMNSALGDIPYETAAAIRRAARAAGDGELLAILDRERVAVVA